MGLGQQSVHPEQEERCGQNSADQQPADQTDQQAAAEPAPEAPLSNCRHALLYIDNKLTKSQMIEKMAQQTRALARRQITWFRGDKEVKWVLNASAQLS